jgi:hypothetical protein
VVPQMQARLRHHVDAGALPDGVRAPGARPRGAIRDGENHGGGGESHRGKSSRGGRYLNAGVHFRAHHSFHE